MYEIGIIMNNELINVVDENEVLAIMKKKEYFYLDNTDKFVEFTIEILINVIDRLIMLTSMQLNTVITQYDIEVHRTNNNISIFFIADY